MNKVLIIDDEKNLIFTVKTFLYNDGYYVKTAENYSEAMDLISKENFDLILIDIMLNEEKNGIDILTEIKKRDISCPVVVFTGYPNIETASEAVRLGAFDYIPKPLRKDILLNVTKKAIEYKTLKEEKEKYRLNLEAIFKSMKEGLISVDKDLKLIEMNEAAMDICGFDRNEILSMEDIFGLSNHTCLDIIKQTIEKKEPHELNHTKFKDKNGNNNIISITTWPLINEKNILSGAVILIRDETRLNYLEKILKKRISFQNIIGKNSKMQKIYGLIETLADVTTTILITGESGTGKELVAEAIHYKGNRRDKPFIKVNCSAISETLLESELFGHIKGAFTGAIKDKVGYFKEAHGGTIFLDEIGDISYNMQLRLLRVLQDNEIILVGDTKPFKVDVRVLAATNQNLMEKVKKGTFREDLYYRLKVIEVKLPSLRERKDDIPLLIEYFLKKFNKKLNKDIKFISKDVVNMFTEYTWPGNIRELEHIMEHMMVLCKKTIITAENLPEDFNKHFNVEIFEKDKNECLAIKTALEKAGGNKSKAARLLGISRTTIYEKIKEYGLD